MPALSRRKLIVGATSALGLAGVLDSVPVAQAGAGPISGHSGPVHSFALRAVELRVVGAPGASRVIEVGASRTLRATLVDLSTGKVVGAFFASGTALALHDSRSNDHGFFEHHLFSWDGAGATLTATGLVRHDGSGTFTITGGTGRFAATRGSYVSNQRPDHSGRGDGDFAFTLDS